MDIDLISPCGMNCAICIAYLREKNKCPGCNLDLKDKPITRVRCKIKTCAVIKEKNWKRCSIKCKNFPCENIKKLDKRYRTKYGMSMIDNIKTIDSFGIKRFIDIEKNKYIKKDKVFCIHDKKYHNF